MNDPTAVILTLRLDAAAEARFTALRAAHFPPERNFLAAHVTLFHALPTPALDRVLRDVDEVARATAPFEVAVERVYSLGRGVAFGLAAAPATALRRTLAARWDDLLGRQDRAGPGRLHVTVQNKVEPGEARALLETLSSSFRPTTVGAVGLGVWGYLGGPWTPIAAPDFRGSPG